MFAVLWGYIRFVRFVLNLYMYLSILVRRVSRLADLYEIHTCIGKLSKTFVCIIITNLQGMKFCIISVQGDFKVQCYPILHYHVYT